jgi:hypothetical protein
MASTPLYKRLKTKGTTFIAFPSSSNDFNTFQFQESFDFQVTKFVLLNIPKSDSDTGGKVLNFSKTNVLDPTHGINTFNFDPNSSYPVKYSEQLVESIRNYIANQDACFRETRISINKDFYNPMERKTPAEEIFWKWCKLHNIIDLEPAEHKIDWDKNLSDFDNTNAATTINTDYFRKYLWKEREVRYYDCIVTGNGSTIDVLIPSYAKFRVGDNILFSGSTTLPVPTELSGTTNIITVVDLSVTDQTTLNISNSLTTPWSGTCYLSYHKLVQYIGEIQATSKVQSSQQTFTEFTAMIPAHAGQTPTVLFETTNNTNYYPGLEIPILDEQIQDEIIGSENLSSPIRSNPNDYPGSYFGYFDTIDKTYKMSNGDSMRYSGDYYGVKRVNNVGLSADDVFENLTDFDSTSIDGLCMDFNLNHYYRAQTASSTINNFDEFDTISTNGNPPADFDFNAILWYYTIHDHTTDKTYTNLYGIEFLDNPDNDFGSDNDRTITLTKKLVTNSSQDGYSYIYNLNLNFAVDNDMLPLRYDPTSVYDIFGFDLYNKVMSNYVLLTEQFQTIIGEFLNMNDKINKLQSLLYSQTDINDIKSRLRNMEDLLKMYQTNQFVDSDTVKLSIDYTKNYPAMSFNAVNVDYSEIYNIYTTDIYNYNLAHSGNTTGITSTISQLITVPNTGKFLVNVFNNMVVDTNSAVLQISLDKDLAFKQSVDFILRPDIALYTNELNINVMFSDGAANVRTEKLLVGPTDTPVDISVYDATNPTGSTFNNSYYMKLSTFVDRLTTGSTFGTGTTIDFKEDLFYVNDWIYIEDMFVLSGSTGTTYVDFSGLYKIVHLVGIQAIIDWDTSGLDIKLRGTPKAHYYKGIKLSVLRIDSSDTSDINHRYLIGKEFINEEIQNIQYAPTSYITP